MRTYIGKAGWWNEDSEDFEFGELEMDDYVSKIYFNDGSWTEINISDEILYEVEVNTEGLYHDIVFIKDNRDHMYHGFSVEKNSNKALNIKEHFNKLNQSFIQKQKEFLKRVEQSFDLISENGDISYLIYNFVDKTDKFLFLDLKQLICFERLLLFKFGIGKLTLLTNEVYPHQLTFWAVTEDFDDDVNIDDLISYYDEYFFKLVKIIDRKVGFETEEQSVFVVWKLLMQQVSNYFYNIFEKEYGQHISNKVKSSLNACIRSYSEIDQLDIYSISNASIFTYYLMYLNKFECNHNFLECNKELIDQLAKIIESKDLDNFEASLMGKSNNNDYD